MHDEDVKRYSFGHLAIAFFGGALAAVAATLLTTPITGRESRAHVVRLAKRGKVVLAQAPDVIRRGLRRGKRGIKAYVEPVTDELG